MQNKSNYIINYLLIFFFGVSLLASLERAYYIFVPPTPAPGAPLSFILSITLFQLFLLYLSHRGRPRLAAGLFLVLLTIPTVYTSLVWGSMVPQAVAMYAVIIIFAGLLVHSSAAVITAIGVTIFMTILSWLQESGRVPFDSSWSIQNTGPLDGLVMGLTLSIMAVVAWLSNREIERSLRRAEASEAELLKQRDILEDTVAERTQALKQAQFEKLVELNRFVEFGRVASGLLHDFVNPLTVVSLTLEELKASAPAPKKTSGHAGRGTSTTAKNIDAVAKNSDTKNLLDRAFQATDKLERFVMAARKQVQTHELVERFLVAAEITQALDMLNHKARKANVTLEFEPDASPHYTGNPIKFFQVMTNLVSNAIDAYAKSRKRKKRVTVQLAQRTTEQPILITITDHGTGISAQDLPHVFDPFYTTKPANQGTGIGLAIAKTIIEEDFGGKITAASTPTTGTVFTVELPSEPREKKP